MQNAIFCLVSTKMMLSSGAVHYLKLVDVISGPQNKLNCISLWQGSESRPIHLAKRSTAQAVADRLVGLQVRISPGAWIIVSCIAHAETAATGRSLVQRSATEYGVSLSVIRCKNIPLQLRCVGRKCRRKNISRVLTVLYEAVRVLWQETRGTASH